MLKRNNRTQRAIARLIVNAQCYSDAAKGIFSLPYTGSGDVCTSLYYHEKDLCIQKAIEAIKNYGPDCPFQAAVCIDRDAYVLYSTVVYFEYEICGHKAQISFHTPRNFNEEDYSAYHHWKQKESSRNEAYSLGKFYRFF